MVAMTFLTTLDGTAEYRTATGGGTLVGTPNHYEAGYWPGSQGAVITSIAEDLQLPYADTLTVADSYTSGEVLVRFRPNVVDGTLRYVLALGAFGNGDILLGVRLMTDNTIQTVYYTGTKANLEATFAVASAGTSYVARAWWDGLSVGGAVGNATPVTGTRSAPTRAFGQAAALGLQLGERQDANPFNGLIDAVALFDAKLSDAEYAVYRDATEPWVWNQHKDAPVVDAGGAAAVAQYAVWSQAGSFADPDSASWTATVDYGDGGGAVPLTLSDQTFTLSHTYTTVGTYAVTVSVTDEAGKTGSDTVQVTVVEGLLTGSFVVSNVAGTHPTAPRIPLP